MYSVLVGLLALGSGRALLRSRGLSRRPSSTLLAQDSGVEAVLLGQNRLLVDLWQKVAFPPEDGRESEFRLSAYGLTRRDMPGFIQHFQNCKDCAAGKSR